MVDTKKISQSVDQAVETALQPIRDTSWSQRIYVRGGPLGLALGLLSAYFYVRASRQSHGDMAPEPPSAGDTIRLGVSLMGIIRTITDWGGR